MSKKKTKIIVGATLVSSLCLGAATEYKKAELSPPKSSTMHKAHASPNMPFTEPVKTDFIATLDRIIIAGTALHHTPVSNALMALCVQQKSDLQKGELDARDTVLAQDLIKKASTKPFYAESLAAAHKASTLAKAPQDYSKSCWLAFQKDALYELGKVIETDTVIVMNARASTVEQMFAYHEYLTPAEQQKYRAGLIGMFLTIQMVQHKIKKAATFKKESGI